MTTQSTLPTAPYLPNPVMPVFDDTSLVAPNITWFDGATGELTGSYSQELDEPATRAAWRAAYDAVLLPWRAAYEAEVVAWQAACAALPSSTLPGAYPAAPMPVAAPAVPPLAGSAVWIIDPYHMTSIAPPALQAGFRPVFNASAGTWSQVEDHRNVPLWDVTGAPLPHMNALGPLPAGALLVRPAPTSAQMASALAAAKAQALAGVIAYADNLAASVTAIYPKAEQALWPEQLFEAQAVTANAAASAPLLVMLVACAANNVPVPTSAQVAAVTSAQVSTLAGAVMAKAASLRAIGVAVAQLRTAAQSAIAGAADTAGLAAAITQIETAAASARAALGV